MKVLNFLQFIENLHPSIDPQTGKRYRRNKQIEEVRRIVKSSGVSADRIWITYSDLPKLGIKPEVRESKCTPVGIFAYPVLYYLENNNPLYASNRNYLILFEVSGRLLEVGFDLNKEFDSRINDYASNLKKDTKKTFLRDFKNDIKVVVNKYSIKVNSKILNEKEFDFIIYYYDNLVKAFDIKTNILKGKIIIALKNGDTKEKIDLIIDEFVKPYEEADFVKKIPMKNQLKLICDKFNVNFESVISEFESELYYNYNTGNIYSSNNKLNLNSSSALYEITNIISKILAKKSKNPQWHHLIWNKILIELGFSGVIDTKNTGKVHNAELTQGVFLNVKQLKIIDILNNLSGQYVFDSNQEFKILNQSKNKNFDEKIKSTAAIVSKKINDFNLYNVEKQPIKKTSTPIITIGLFVNLLNELSNYKKNNPNKNLIEVIKTNLLPKLINLKNNLDKNDSSHEYCYKILDLIIKELNSDDVIVNKKIILSKDFPLNVLPNNENVIIQTKFNLNDLNKLNLNKSKDSFNHSMLMTISHFSNIIEAYENGSSGKINLKYLNSHLIAIINSLNEILFLDKNSNYLEQNKPKFLELFHLIKRFKNFIGQQKLFCYQLFDIISNIYSNPEKWEPIKFSVHLSEEDIIEINGY